METNTSKKLYSPGWIGAGTFFGGPYVAAHMMAQNYFRLGKSDLGAKTKKIGLIATVVVLLIALLIPDRVFDRVPSSLLPIIYMSLAIAAVQHYQRAEIENAFKQGWTKESGWKAIGVSLIIALITFSAFFVIAMVLPI